MVDYDKYPDDWSQRREAVMKRDNYRCQRCGAHVSEQPLEVDHVTPISEGGSSSIDNLQVLCAPCHYNEKHEVSPPKHALKNTIRYIDPKNVETMDDVDEIMKGHFGHKYLYNKTVYNLEPFIEYVFGWNETEYNPQGYDFSATHVEKEEVLNHYLLSSTQLSPEELADEFDISVADAKRAIREAW